jgi:hypothetical protein
VSVGSVSLLSLASLPWTPGRIRPASGACGTARGRGGKVDAPAA